MAQAVVVAGAVVVAYDWLHAHGDAEHYGGEQRGVGGEYSGGADGEV